MITTSIPIPIGNPSWDNAKSHERELFHDIRDAHAKQQRKREAYLQGRYLTSYDARLIATRTAYRKLKLSKRPPFNSLPQTAENLHARRGTEEKVEVRWKPKASNQHEFRPVMEFGIENRALQYLVRACISAASDLHPMQFAVNGGRNAAVQRASEALAAGFCHVAELDIKNCYSSFNGETLSSLLPVPKEVVERIVLSRNLNLFPAFPYVQYCDGPPEESYLLAEYLAEARQGIAQGSAASSVVAEVLLAPVLAQMPNSGVALSYADNILLMASSKAEAVSMQKALRCLVDQHPAGPLKLKEPKLYKPGDAVTFLGYTMAIKGTVCHFAPSKQNFSTFQSHFGYLIEQIQDANSSKKQRRRRGVELQQYVNSWSHGFALWPEAEQHRKQHLSMVKDAISAIGK